MRGSFLIGKEETMNEVNGSKDNGIIMIVVRHQDNSSVDFTNEQY